MIITSMNFYDFSMMNNKEMGILIDKTVPEDLTVYNDAWSEIDFIEKTSKPFDFVSNPVTSVTPIKNEVKTEPKIEITANQKVNVFDGKYLSATALSKELGLSSKELNSLFEKLNWITRKNDDWAITSLGERKGAVIKKGQYGEYIAWPDNLIVEISKQLVPKTRW
jgi:hypothetical protein